MITPSTGPPASAGLTDDVFWDAHWKGVTLPVIVDEAQATPQIRAILRVFREYLPNESGTRVLEIGGAPGGYLAWLARAMKYQVAALDSSHIGCEKLRENFALLDIPVDVYERDLRGDLSELPPFEVVYSLGLLEHFDDALPVVRQHVRLTRPGGVVMLGVPNFRGLNHLCARVLRPDILEWHNLRQMRLAGWETFERALGLETIFKGYIGGWEPRMFLGHQSSAFHEFGYRALRKAAAFIDRTPSAQRLNSSLWSGYAIAIYRTSQAG